VLKENPVKISEIPSMSYTALKANTQHLKIITEIIIIKKTHKNVNNLKQSVDVSL